MKEKANLIEKYNNRVGLLTKDFKFYAWKLRVSD